MNEDYINVRPKADEKPA